MFRVWRECAGERAVGGLICRLLRSVASQRVTRHQVKLRKETGIRPLNGRIPERFGVTDLLERPPTTSWRNVSDATLGQSTPEAATWVLTSKIAQVDRCLVPTRRTPLPGWVIDKRRALGENIARYRRGAGLSQDQLAERIGKERRSVQRYERGERDPSFSDLVLIADNLDVTIAALVEMPPAGS